MIVPRYWAEGRAHDDKGGKQVTVRRFGWSDESQADAQMNAQERAIDALQRVLSGEALPRREPKRPYNGALGVPIREEIVDRVGATVITRNSYGARCLNTPDVLFVDIDFPDAPAAGGAFGLSALLLFAAAGAGWFTGSWVLGGGLAVAAVAAGAVAGRAMRRAAAKAAGGAEAAVRQRIEGFVAKRFDWHLRLYRTPAGMRVLAMHRTFDPAEPEVAECFSALGADPLYAAMCLNQKCFRARVSAKPWRIGVDRHIRPRPGIWPVDPARLPERNAWVQAYEAAAKGFAACTFIGTAGRGIPDPTAAGVQALHDDLCRATSALPTA